MKHQLALIALSSGLFLSTKALSLKTQDLHQNQTIQIGNGAEPKDLDPAIVTGVPEAHIVENLFEGLTTLDPFTQEVLPGVATSWTVSQDGRSYTFHLRPDAKWSDGTALTAKDFLFAWERVLNPKTASEYAYQLHPIKGAEHYNKGQTKDFSQVGVKALSDQELLVTLENPIAFFLQLTAFHTLFPTPSQVITKLKDQTQWTRPEHMVSNGPFRLNTWRMNQEIKLVKNEHYWDKDNVFLQESIFLPIENADTEEKKFISGEIHMTSGLPPHRIPQYTKDKSQDFQAHPLLASYFYYFNTEQKPTNDKRVRRALALAIDRQAIVEKITKGGQIPAVQFTPPQVGGYSYQGPKTLPTGTPSQEHIQEAKKLLAEAGYPEGKGLPTLQILYNTGDAHKKVALAIQSMWKKNLNIEAELFNQEWKVYLDTMLKGQYTVARGGWTADYSDPNTFLDLWVTGGGNNRTRWSSKTYDQWIEEAAKTQDHNQRNQIFQKAESLLLEELPILPIYIYTKTNLVSQKIRMIQKNGELSPWTSNPSDRIQLKYYAIAK